MQDVFACFQGYFSWEAESKAEFFIFFLCPETLLPALWRKPATEKSCSTSGNSLTQTQATLALWV